MTFSLQIVLYLFLGGACGGMLFVSSVWCLAVYRTENGNARRQFAFHRYFSRCLIVGLLGLIVATLCLFWDLGKPSRALLLFASPTGSVLSWGVYFLGIELVVVALLAAVFFLSLRVPARIVRLAIALCAVASAAVFTYTGVYLYSLEAIAFWHFPALIAVFVFASLSAGFSLMLLVTYFSSDSVTVLSAIKPLQRAHLAAIIAEAVAIGWLLFEQAKSPECADSFALLTGNTMLPLSLIGVGGFAFAVPFCLELSSVRSRNYRNIPGCDVLCLVGSLILRFIIVSCGMH